MICNISGLFMTATYGQVYIWFAYVYTYVGTFPDVIVHWINGTIFCQTWMQCMCICTAIKKKLYRKFQLSRYVMFVCNPSLRLGGVDPGSWQDFWYQSAPGYLPADCHTRHSISKNKKCTFLPLIICSPLVNMPWSFKGKYLWLWIRQMSKTLTLSSNSSPLGNHKIENAA